MFWAWDIYDIYIYIYIYIYTYVHIDMYTYIYIHIHTYIYTYTYIHIFIYSYIQIFIFSYIQIFIFSYIHIFIYSYIHIFIYLYIHIFIYSYIHIHDWWMVCVNALSIFGTPAKASVLTKFLGMPKCIKRHFTIFDSSHYSHAWCRNSPALPHVSQLQTGSNSYRDLPFVPINMGKGIQIMG